MKGTFEENIVELEKVVIQLEQGDMALDKAIEVFEKGISLSKECNKKLDDAEKKINILIESNGEVSEEAFNTEKNI